MSETFDDHLNPYASPREFSREGFLSNEPQLGNFKAAVQPRNAIDAIITFLFGCGFATLLYGIPIAALVLLGAPVWSYFAVIGGILLFALFAVLSCIRRFELRSDELVLFRSVLPRVRLAWSEVDEVRPARRGEVLRCTVLRPHRCCAYSMGTQDQVAVSARGVTYYFPPPDFLTVYGSCLALKQSAEVGAGSGA